MNKTRKDFTHSAILSKIHSSFVTLTQKTNKRGVIKTSDCLMSALAIFALKYPSLLSFEEHRTTNKIIKHNLGSLYHVGKVPCDTYLRERLDGLDLSIIRVVFSKLLLLLQRGKVLDVWKFLNNKFLISLDASEFFSSNEIRCESCCTKILHKGTDKEVTTYHHQMLVGSIVTPLCKQVFPVNFEPVIKEDGNKKNDCERNCAKRWLETFRKSHPKLPTIIVADGLYSNAPFIRNLQDQRCSFILVAKADDHKYLYDYFWAGDAEVIGQFESSYKHKNVEYKGKYRFMNNVPLNDANHDLKVNVLHYEELAPKKNKVTKWLWVTDIKISRDNAKTIMQAGRARWKIENETFNTLKNQGYNFEHNFGHGYKGLSNVFAGMMLLAFFVDQILEALNLEFKASIEKCLSRRNFFEKTRALFLTFFIKSYDILYNNILDPPAIWLE
jgi:hypothetical protein